MKTIHPKPLRSLWPLLLPLLIFIPGLDGFPYPSPDAMYSDIAITHYPNAVYLKAALFEYHVVPFWSPTILSGYPFAANPLSGLWYPPGWLAIVLPLPLGFNLLAALHILWGGLGMYGLLRGEDASHRAAILGALAFESLPKVFAHYGGGHLTLIYAISWTPWLLITPHVARIEFSVFHRSIHLRLIPGAILGLIILADPRWAAYAVMIWLFYEFTQGQIRLSTAQGNPMGSAILNPRERLRSLVSVFQSSFVQVVLGSLLAAPLLLPLLEFARLSTRASISPEEAMLLSLPPGRLLGLIFPDFGGNHEWTLYPGAIILVLVLFAILKDHRRSLEKFWLGMGFLTLVLALGSNIPGLGYLSGLPGLSLLRVPSRSLFLTGMAFSMVAAHTVDDLFSASKIHKQSRISLGFTGLVALTFALAGGVWFFTQEIPLNFVWGAGMILCGSLWVGGRLKGRIPPQIWYATLIGLAILDWGAINLSVLSFRPKAEILSEQTEVTQYLANQTGFFRTYSPSYSIPQQTGVHAGLELAEGVDPLQLAAYADYMAAATGVPRSGYAVTLPPFATGEPAIDNVAYLPDPYFLGLLNVKYVVSEFELVVEGLELRQQFGETRVYANAAALPRAWVQPRDTPLGTDFSAMDTLDWTPNRITLEAEGPGLLVLSEIAYPGWMVWVDAQPVPMETVGGLLRGVNLEMGSHQVEFVFRPLSVYFGISSFVVGLGLIFVLETRFSKRFKNYP